jgi:hypothetical protein
MHAQRFSVGTWLLTLALAFRFCAIAAASVNVEQIVQRSVAANEADWKAAPKYAFTEHDVITKRGGTPAIKTYQVLMIDGSQYNRLVAINNRPLTAGENAEEESKLKLEMTRRQHESARQRERRIGKYEHDRRQDHEMMNEMAAAFTYRLVGEETLDGHSVYVLDASPKPGYEPHSRETRVLLGMRGRMWIDKDTYQWVKVVAEVTKPVEFGLFVAKVGPGTRFELEQEPVGDGIWMPAHFSMKVNASVLGFYSENSTDDETYTHYQPNRVVLAALIK